MDEQSYRPSWLAQMFGNSVTKATLNESGIQFFQDSAEPDSLNWSGISRPPTLTSGIIFAKVIFQSDQQKFSVNWISKKSAASLYAEASQQFYRHQSTLAENILNEISAKLNEIGYLRSSHCTEIGEFLHKALKQVHIPPAHLKLSEEVGISFGRLLEWIHPEPEFIRAIRDRYVTKQKQRYQTLFDSIESNPLTERQRDACIIDEDNNLVLAGAGTGKTSTMIGRAAYLLESGQAKDKEILMLAYGRKAAIEMRDRLKEKLDGASVLASTFHSLGQQIIIQIERAKPSVSPLCLDEKLLAKHIDHWFTELLEESEYKKKALKYFERYLYPDKNAFDFKSEGEYFEYLRNNEIRTLKGEAVKSYEECLIANWLFRMGIEYQYETTYKESDTRTPDFRAYKPDFYLKGTGVYLEHFGIDRQGNTAPYIDKTIYQQSMEWKRQLHVEQETTLIESYHYEQQEKCLLTNLEYKLREVGVEFEPLPDEALFETLKEFGAISIFSSLLGKLLQRYKACDFDAESLQNKIDSADNPGQLSAAIDLLLPVVDQYENQLSLNEEIDFEDMLSIAVSYVEQGLFKSPWRYILVDEFQDISEPRARLVKALRDSRKGASIFCVGDDWQAIYRFTGSDVALTTNFEQHFGHTQTTSLDKTFRFNSSICDIASKFVMQNSAQVEKLITTHDIVTEPAVSIVRRSLPNDGISRPIYDILQKISAEADPSTSVYLLARYWFILPDRDHLKRIQAAFPALKIDVLTLHACKGKEADYVVLLGLDNSKHGFPSHRVTHPLLEALLPPAETHEYAEERRLFYVGLTRARHRAYILCDMSKASVFVKELMSGKYDIALDEFPTSDCQIAATETNCPGCDSGILVQRKKDKNTFIGCTNYPICKHTESTCTKCNQGMKRQDRFRICIDDHCNTWVPMCSSCNGDLKLRHSPYGQFWGCSNYRSEGTSCGHKEKIINPPSTVDH